MNTPSKPCEIRRLLLISMILVPAIPLLLTAAIGFYAFSETTRGYAVSSLSQAVVDHRRMIDDFLKERRGDLESFLSLLPPEALTGEFARQEVAAMLKTGGGAFQDMGIIGPDGTHTAYAGPYDLLNKDYRQAPWYVETLRMGYYVSDVFLGYRNVPHFVAAVVRRIDGRPWVLRATINSAVFEDIVNAVNIGDSGEAYVLNRENRFQTGRRSGGALLEEDDSVYPPQQGDLMTFTDEKDGEGYLSASAPLNDGKWRLIVRQKTAEAFNDTVMAGYTVLLCLLCGGAVVVVLAIVVSRRLSDAMEEKTEAVRKLEGQLLQAARLAELGEMAAGFAHEINNPLQIMKADLALFDLTLKDITEREADNGENNEAKAELTSIANQLNIQIDRCAAITREILRFGRQDAPCTQPLEMAVYLPRLWSMVENKAQVHGIKLHCDVAPHIPTIQADPGQLQQVMINLVNNAIHAVVERHGSEGGEIEVSAQKDDRGNAVITVSDNGTGMSRDHLGKIFMPFFTTKAPGQGTGLGLSVCHSIIDSMGGELSVASRKGEGTTFTVTIPGMKAS
ncbi:sensor histidine kinase [Pseudodesulfovibrio portus]|uniref:histidine kinase n=1 Tax=Pseudodesulfovibrio portus TaxID=231439 RepID=A0ABM8AU59_9BACT|nr:sensor histidine kinase [Pseudodesulfovibrio portus]BDQ34845.1 two-component sensor histidine kinase [Pseudodesulfovibrio portus]